MSENLTTFGASLPVIGNQIRKWRLEKKVTQAELEQRSGLSHNTVSRIECGAVSPRIDTVERIAQALGLSVEELQFQKPVQKVAEHQAKYFNDKNIEKMVAALKKIPEPKRGNLLRTFMELIRIAAGEDDE